MTTAALAGTERPPRWLIVATGLMALVLLAMSVGETSLKGQYLIDQGEYLSLVGLAFILAAGVYLHRQERLAASLPLVFPWLLYPVITQGDQIIDNLSITWMRIIVHVLLAAIFAMPVAIVVYAARGLMKRSPPASRNLAIALLAIEIVLAQMFLGALMIGTLLLMIALVWRYGGRHRRVDERARARRGAVALTVLVGGVIVSGGLYLGFKNRPGSYQGSPSYYMDPMQASGFHSSTPVPTGPVNLPPGTDDLRAAFTGYAECLQHVLDGYYILDRNYNYHFHNELFVRNTPLLPNYRAEGLSRIKQAREQCRIADDKVQTVHFTNDNPLGAFVSDVAAYAAFTFGRAATLERMSAEFETTKAGLQHATHIYEGEGKYLGVQLAAVLDKHRAVLQAPAARPIVNDFVIKSRAIEERYANRIVGF